MHLHTQPFHSFLNKKGAGNVAQCKGPAFKLQYHQRKIFAALPYCDAALIEIKIADLRLLREISLKSSTREVRENR